MIHFVAEVAGVEVLNRAFNRVEEHISDFRGVWPEVVGEIYQINADQFDSEGARGASGKWAALSPAYKRWKDVYYPGELILQQTHNLVDSLTDPNAADAIYSPGPNELIIGTKVPYARKQHNKRPIFSFSEQQKRRIQKTIQRNLVAFTRRVGFQVDEERAA